MISIATSRRANLCSIAIAALVAAPIVNASLPEIIVTADYREANELDTAYSISVLTEGGQSNQALVHVRLHKRFGHVNRVRGDA